MIATIAARLLATAKLSGEQEARIDRTATRLIEAIRANDDPLGGVEDMLREFALSTKEGLALMVLAEALLRVPDARTADQFIEDKLGQGDFVHHETKSSAFLVNASAWALGMSARVIQPGETPQGTIGRLTKRLGAPAVRAATRQAMRLMGSHFVLGETIEAALARAEAHASRHRRYSFDMLGEGARTAADAARYFDSYARAIDAIGRAANNRPLPDRPGISVKLSALHPRFEAVSHSRVMSELVPRLIDLARQAKTFDLNFTVDAEEADRLELSLDVIAAAFADPSLAGWDGFGLAIQAYQKRAREVIDHVDGLAKSLNRRMMVRLVKGAYWDTEIKRAQERGLDGYPVFTRKAMTDLNYVACAQQLLGLRPRIFPQFATHNALTVATLLELAKDESGFEFQRLHGMGEALYAQLSEDHPDIACRTYAPVGSHRDLLAYLVRRLLENGANSSFVALAADEAVPVAHVAAASGGSHRQCRQGRASEHPVAARSVFAAADELARAGIRRARGVGPARLPMSPRKLARGRQHRRCDAGRSQRGDLGRARRIQGLEPNAGRDARAHRWKRPPTCWNNARRISSRCCNARAARRWMTRCRRSAKPSISAAIMPRRAANSSATARRCRARPARAMCSPCAAAASSSRSRRGIFRWRSSWARSRRR